MREAGLLLGIISHRLTTLCCCQQDFCLMTLKSQPHFVCLYNKESDYVLSACCVRANSGLDNRSQLRTNVYWLQ